MINFKNITVALAFCAIGISAAFVTDYLMSVREINRLTIENLKLRNEREKAETEHTQLLSEVIKQEELWLHEAIKP